MSEPFVFKVNLGGMIDILSNHLYSSPDVFVRELLQNGTDAISGRRLIEQRFGEGEITIRVTPGKSLVFTDNGTGLTEPEIHQFLAVIGQSSKRDLTTGRILDDYIGRFGIGMLSCFMVTDEIMLRTRSVKDPSHAYEFHGKPDGTYSITEIPAEETALGTAIHIKAKKGCEQYFDEAEIVRLVRYYGMPLPFPVMMHGAEGVYRINEMLSLGSDARESVMELGREIFDMDFLDYIPLESKSGLFSGVAFIMPHAVSFHAKTKHRIYLKHMLLTEDGDAILPKWSGFLRCFLNTTSLRPTASRENFYEDDLLAKAREELSECISQHLIRMAHRDPALLENMIRIHFMAIKSMASEDELFFRTFIPYIRFETNMGELSGKELLSRADDIGFTTDSNQFHRVSALMLSQGHLLVNACYVYDAALLRMLQEEYDEEVVVYPLAFVNFDQFLEDPGTDAQKTAANLVNTANGVLMQFDCDAQVKYFSPSDLPVFYLLDDNAKTLREIRHSKENSSELFASMLDAFAEEIDSSEAVLYLNWSNPLIKRLAGIRDQEKLRVCIEILYVQALLTGRFPMQGTELSMLNKNLIQLIEWGTTEQEGEYAQL